MKTMSKIIGIVLLVAIGVPLLMGAIFATGMTQAATDPVFYADLSHKVVERIPDLIQKSFAAAQQPGAVEDPDRRAWLEAMGKAETPFVEMLKNTGIQGWLNDEVVGSIERVGRVMRGELQTEDVALDLRPLKKALASDEMRAYLGQVLQHLPACDEAGLESWKQRLISHSHGKPFPACNPGEENIQQGSEWIAARIGQIPDRRQVLTHNRFHSTFDAVQMVNTVMWLVFLIPVLIIAIGAGLAGSGGRGFMGYSGGTVLAGGLVSWLLAGLASGWLLSLVDWDSLRWTNGAEMQFFDSSAGRVLAQELAGMARVVLDDLFSPVVAISAIVCAVGLALAILSLLFERKQTKAG